MTKEKLEAYNAAAVEMAMIGAELDLFHGVQHSVKGSMPEHPCVLQTIPITGIDLAVAGMLEARRDKLRALRLEVQQFLATVDDPYMALLLRLRFVNGLKWDEMAAKAGGGNTENGIRMAVERFLAKA